MIEAGVIVVDGQPVYWHSPKGRTGGSLPDSRTLWEVLWIHRKAESLGFAHSHPGSGIPSPSHTDITTFAAVEVGLGRRMVWWITSSDRVIALRWCGPGKHDYESEIIEEPVWARTLRKNSEEKENGKRERESR